MSSQSAGAQLVSIPKPPSPSHNEVQSVQTSIAGSIRSIANASITVLKSTVWPGKAMDAAQDLVRIVDNAPKLKNIPKDDTQISADDRASLEKFLKVVKDVQLKLKEASKAYGEKQSDSKLGSKFKRLITPHRDQCTTVLKSCQNEIEDGIASLPARWAHESETRDITINSRGPAGSESQAPLVADPSDPGLETIQISLQSQFPAQTTIESGNTLAAPASARDQLRDTRSDKVEPDSGRREWLSMARTTMATMEAISGAVPIVGSVVGAAAKIGVALISILQNMDCNAELTKDLQSRTSRLLELLKRLDKRTIEHQEEDITAHVGNLIKELELVRDKVKELDTRGTFKSFMASDEHAETLKGHQETIRTALEEIQLLVSLNVRDLFTQLYDAEVRKEQRRLLDRLGDANYGARGDAIEDVTCLPGTRTQVLERIDGWIRDSETSGRVLWIRGMAGRGKSTIVSTIAHRWRYRAACAIFHFRRGQSTLDKRVVCALARQLGRSGVPEVKESVLRSIKEDEDIAQGRLQDQFVALFVNPLKELKNTTSPVLLIVDALDECESTQSAVKFVNLIDLYLPSLARNVKFLLSTRPEAPLLRALDPRSWNTEDLDTATNVDDDIAEFLKLGFLKIRTQHGLEEDWPPPDSLPELVRLSQGFFQWAHTAMEYMLEGSPQLRLEELLKSPTTCDGTDGLYLQILSKAFKKAMQNPSREDLFVRTLGTLVAALYPISLEIIAYIFADHAILRNLSQESIIQLFRQEVLSDLGSLIHVPHSSADPIRLVHTSVRDLLVDRNRCAGGSYWVNLPNNHRHLTSKFLQLMERDLRINICNLSDLSRPNSDSDVQDLVRLNVPKGLQYCCYAWSLHLVAWTSSSGFDTWEGILSDLKRFSEERFLGWLEVMSLIGRARESMAAAKQVKSLLQGCNKVPDPWLAALWSDAHRFIVAFYEPISYGVPHIYASALPFCPVRTPLWECYGSFARTRILNGPRDLTWPSNLWSKHNHRQVLSVAISPDSMVIAFGLHDGTIRLCDPETGFDIGKPLKGHNGWVRSVVFSPDGRVLASGSNDWAIRLWDPESGAPIGEPLEGHGGSVQSVAFSPNGKLIASGCLDKTVRIWYLEAGAPNGGSRSLMGHHDSVESVAFSPNGGILASGSKDHTVRLWNPESGAPIREFLIGHSGPVLAVAFSLDGKTLASGSGDRTIRLWDPKTGALTQAPLEGHKGPVCSVAFSQDSKVLASGSSDHTIRLWESPSGLPIGETLEGHVGQISSVAFARNTKVLVSGSFDETIRLWDIESRLTTSSPQIGNEDLDHTFALHSNSTLSASGMRDKTNRLPKPETKTSLKTPPGALIWAIASSHLGKMVASGSNGWRIQLWGILDGEPIGKSLEGHEGPVWSVAFSPDGRILASGSKDNIVRLWDVKTGTPIGEPLKGHGGPVCSVAFSPDGRVLASGSEDHTVRFWDASSGASIGEPCKCLDGPVWSVAFSPNGGVLASGSGNAIRFWDTKTKTLLDDHFLIRDLPEAPNTVFFLMNGQLVLQYNDGPTALLDTRASPMAIADSPAQNDYKTFLPSTHPINLGFRGQWVTFLSNRLFWLPQKYWSRRLIGSNLIMLSHDILVLAYDGMVLFFDVGRALDC